MIKRLFVYGTLVPGGPNEHVLQQIGGTWQPGTVKGTLYKEGWGAALGYPAIVLDAHGAEVHGFLFSSENLPDHWAELDEFEGEGYQRVLTKVTLSDNKIVDAYIYALKGD
jgi:gamma-glutamylcyclotransferase (GGCT)/AIG2-like uncharacterized protein YtfP